MTAGAGPLAFVPPSSPRQRQFLSSIDRVSSGRHNLNHNGAQQLQVALLPPSLWSDVVVVSTTTSSSAIGSLIMPPSTTTTTSTTPTILAGLSVAISVTSLVLSYRTWRLQQKQRKREEEVSLPSKQAVSAMGDATVAATTSSTKEHSEDNNNNNDPINAYQKQLQQKANQAETEAKERRRQRQAELSELFVMYGLDPSTAFSNNSNNNDSSATAEAAEEVDENKKEDSVRLQKEPKTTTTITTTTTKSNDMHDDHVHDALAKENQQLKQALKELQSNLSSYDDTIQNLKRRLETIQNSNNNANDNGNTSSTKEEEEEQETKEQNSTNSKSNQRIRATLENQVLLSSPSAVNGNNGNNNNKNQQQQKSLLQVQPIGTIRSIYRLCVGTPRQGLLVPHSRGVIQLTLPNDIAMDCVKELDSYSHVWILFVFHLNTLSTKKQGKIAPKIAPPALGGTTKVGVLATRSPHRFNPIGITLAKLERIEIIDKKLAKNKGIANRVLLHISGLDLVDGTPVLDVKPYVPVYDSVPPEPDLTQQQQQQQQQHVNGQQKHNGEGSISISRKNGSSSSNVRLPSWVSEGLDTKRSVTISESALKDLKNIIAEPTKGKNKKKKKTKSALEFYGLHSTYSAKKDGGGESNEEAIDNIVACITEVLAMDVRSSWQTKKARRGNYQAERAIRIKGTTNNNKKKEQQLQPPSSSSSLPEATEDSSSSANDTAVTTTTASTNGNSNSNTCTQQLDNLLLHYTVTETSTTQRTESAGSGAEDHVLVTSIERLEED